MDRLGCTKPSILRHVHEGPFREEPVVPWSEEVPLRHLISWMDHPGVREDSRWLMEGSERFQGGTARRYNFVAVEQSN